MMESQQFVPLPFIPERTFSNIRRCGPNWADCTALYGAVRLARVVRVDQMDNLGMLGNLARLYRAASAYKVDQKWSTLTWWRGMFSKGQVATTEEDEAALRPSVHR